MLANHTGISSVWKCILFWKKKIKFYDLVIWSNMWTLW
jgi:hypothetical protein